MNHHKFAISYKQRAGSHYEPLDWMGGLFRRPWQSYHDFRDIEDGVRLVRRKHV